MSDLLRIPTEGGGELVVAGSSPPGGPIRAGRVDDVVHDATFTLQAALDPVAKAAGAILEQLRRASPDEVEVCFGVELSAQAGAVIAKGTAGCHLQVKLAWKQGTGSDEPRST